MTDRELIQKALDSLEYGLDYVKSEELTNKQSYKGYEHLCPDDSYYVKLIETSIEALRARLVHPEPEPPRFPTMLRKMWSGTEVQEWINQHYTAPPQREWQGLTDEEEITLTRKYRGGEIVSLIGELSAMLREKNT